MQAESSDANIEPISCALSINARYSNSVNNNISLITCSNTNGCLALLDILKSFNAAISEEQAWALIYQSVKLYRDYCQKLGENIKYDSNATSYEMNKYVIEVPCNTQNLRIHKDGSVHISIMDIGELFICYYVV